MIKNLSAIWVAAAILSVGACDTSTGLSGNLSQADVNDLAASMDAGSTIAPSDLGLGPVSALRADQGQTASATASSTTLASQFTVTRQCPRGGQAVLDGTTAGTADATTGSLSLEVIATRTDANCAFQTRNGVVTVTGNPNIAYDGKLNVVNSALSGLQTQTHKGSFNWARGNASGTCDVDIASSFDPATHSVSITGTFCGMSLSFTANRAG